ncbi:MAG: CBS domain-containing protein, partial [bacterium]
DGKLYLTQVDASRAGLLRRMKLGFLNKWLYGKKESPDLVPWNYVHVPADLGRLKGQLRINVQKEKLKDIHPADLADILEELGHEERMEIFDGLDTEKAADTLEEIEPRVQRQLIKSIRQERIGEIFLTMTSAQLADLFSILPNEESSKFIEKLDPDKARKVRAILSQREETVASLVSRTFVAFPGDITVSEALERYRIEAIDRAVIMYTYIIAEDNTLLGVLDVRELIQAEPDELLEDIMVKNVISVEPDDAKDGVVALFKKYLFRAVPVVDPQDRLIGVIRFKDVFIGQRSPVSNQ